MDSLLFIFDGMIEDGFKPIFAYVEFGDGIVLNDLEYEIIGSIENFLECIVFKFIFLIDLLQDFLTHQSEYFEQFVAYFQIFGDILFLLIRKSILFNIVGIAFLDKNNQHFQQLIDKVKSLCLHFLLKL